MRLEIGDIGSSQSEVADFQVAVRIDEQVARLQVTMQDASRVDVLEPSEKLVEKELYVII